MGWILGSACSSMVANCKFNLLSRNLSTSSLVIPGISAVALMIFIILQRHTNRKEFLASSSSTKISSFTVFRNVNSILHICADILQLQLLLYFYSLSYF